MSAFITDVPAARKPRAHPEDDLQCAIVQHLKLRGAPSVLWYAVPNGSYKSQRSAARFKRQGLVAGIPDLAFVLADGRAAFVELKSRTGRLSPEQKAVLARLDAMQVPYLVSSNLDEVLGTLKMWGVLK